MANARINGNASMPETQTAAPTPRKRGRPPNSARAAVATMTASESKTEETAAKPKRSRSATLEAIETPFPPPQDVYSSNYLSSAHPAGYPVPDNRGLAAAAAFAARNSGFDSAIVGADRPYYSESHMAEVLQRENNTYDDLPPQEYPPPTTESEPSAAHFAAYANARDREAQMLAEGERKRRKRVFSNRTKTGCMTCRRRKKKCDEQHPECNNCLRGGFVCEGYTVRNTWQKPEKGPSSQRSGSYDGEAASMYQEGSPSYPTSQNHEFPYNNGAQTSPEREYTPGNTAYVESQQLKREPNLETSAAAAAAAFAAAAAASTESERPERSSITQSHVQAAAEAALIETIQSDPQSDLDKMLSGKFYYTLAPSLVADREQCMAAVWRFNQSLNPETQMTPETRSRLFGDIVALRPSAAKSAGPAGSCGERTVVEAPFYCDYGYNLCVGDDVLIGPECRISDACSVNIGARSILSSNVRIICSTFAIDYRERQGSSSDAVAQAIAIEEDCWIGAGTTILAGVRIGRGSTVANASLVHKDVPPFTVVSGNPAEITRSIYEDPAEDR